MARKHRTSVWDGLVGSLEAVNAPLVALFGKKETKQAAAGLGGAAATAIGGPLAGAAVAGMLSPGEDTAAPAGAQVAIGSAPAIRASVASGGKPWPTWAPWAAGVAIVGVGIAVLTGRRRSRQ